MEGKKFPEHTLFKFKLFGRTCTLRWCFDTFRTPKGNDKLLTNVVRVMGIFGIVSLPYLNNWYYIPLYCFIVLCVGVTEIKFFQYKQKRATFKSW